MAAEGIHEAHIDAYLEVYATNYLAVPGAPAPIDAVVEDAPAIANFESYADESWQAFTERLSAVAKSQAKAFNPYLPRWSGKTDDDTPWLSDSGNISDAGRQKLDSLFANCSPLSAVKGQALFEEAPITDWTALSDVIKAMIRLPNLFVWSMGDPDLHPDFAWTTLLTMTAGLGQQGARTMLANLNDATADYLATCTPQEFAAEVTKAQLVCGYPAGLWRVEWHRLKSALATEDLLDELGRPKTIRWFKSVVALHILKHVRYHCGPNGNFLVAAYRGRHCRIPTEVESVDMMFTGSNNKRALGDLCEVLRLPSPFSRKPTWMEANVRAVFEGLRPRDILRTKPLFSMPWYLPAPSVTIASVVEEYQQYRWIDPGTGVFNVATLDVATGDVDIDGCVRGVHALDLAWPVGECDAKALAKWRSNVPRHVEAARPSEVASRYIFNRNTLGHAEGANALLDAIMAADLFRTELSGSEIGNVLGQEYPPVFVLPMGATEESTTNQGKTSMAVLLCGALVPGIGYLKYQESASAPTQRSMAEPIYQYGTAVYDEFLISRKPDHFLNKSGIQALATGGASSPGRAGENAMPLTLSHPLFFAAKLLSVPEDIYNRMYAMFMDVITDENRTSEEELSKIQGGSTPFLVRLSFIRWALLNNLVAEIKALKLVSGAIWRFNAHLAIAQLFATPEQIAGYMNAMKDQCRTQLVAADDSGLAAELDQYPVFEPLYYLNNCDEMTLSTLAMMSEQKDKGKAPLAPLTAFREIVEDQNRRKFDTQLKTYNIKEKGAVQKFCTALAKAGEIERFGYKIGYVDRETSTCKGDGGRPVAYVYVNRPPKPVETKK